MAGHGAKATFTRGDQVEGVELNESLVTAVFGTVTDFESVRLMRQALKTWLTIVHQSKTGHSWQQAADFVENNSTDIS